MNQLSENSCEACRIDAPKLSEKEIHDLLPEVSNWELVNVSGIPQLERAYIFKDFVSALAFAVAVGDIAEEEGHHPAVLVEWGKVKVNWWSHKIKGLHKNDFVMAAKTDVVYSNSKS